MMRGHSRAIAVAVVLTLFALLGSAAAEPRRPRAGVGDDGAPGGAPDVLGARRHRRVRDVPVRDDGPGGRLVERRGGPPPRQLLVRLNALGRRRTKNPSSTTCARFLPGVTLISLSQWAHPLHGSFCGIEHGSYRRRHYSLPELMNARSGTFLGVLMTPLWGACSIKHNQLNTSCVYCRTQRT